MMLQRGGRTLVWVGALTAASILGSSSATARSEPPPNIIVVQTDDQDAASLTRTVMPKTVKLLRRPGTTFTDYVDSGPLCCPSRAVLLTGQYGHNNGVMWDNPNPYGDLRGKGNTLPVWLHRAGYRTAHLGKFLNLYAKAVGDPNEVAPGWDEWHTVLDPVDYYDYTLHQNGRSVRYGDRDADYLTKVLNEKAVHMIRRYVPHRRPLFMEIDQFAPHASPVTHHKGGCHGWALPAQSDIDLFKHKPLPMPPSFNEADVSDKPSFIRAHPPFKPEGIQLVTRQYRCRLASLRAVDRGVAEVVKALRREHELADTAILFTSDNGWLEGQHRVPGGKVDPYEEALHVPFVIRLPKDMRPRHGVPRRLSSTVANVDVAPTILGLAGARPCSRPGDCRTLDGRSMLSAIRGNHRHWPRDRGILLELQTSGSQAMRFTPCDYEGVRTSHEVYTEYHSATRRSNTCVPQEEREHYDLRADPFELDNLFPAPPGSANAAKEAELAARLQVLRDCAGIKGRDPRPSSGHYCD
jgi:N-acetylglucosamine-6-sulfatase